MTEFIFTTFVILLLTQFILTITIANSQNRLQNTFNSKNLETNFIKMSEIDCNQQNSYKVSNKCITNGDCQSYEFCNIDPKAGNSCMGCSQDCDSCLSKTECTRCADERVIMSGICDLCENITLGQECQKFANCKACSRNGCSLCLNDYFVDEQDKCLKQICNQIISCQPRQYCQILPSGNNKCQDCSSNCINCDSISCLQCSDKYNLVSGQCILNECDETNPCASTQFCQIIKNLQNKCVNCSENCQKCSNGTVCEICENNFYETSVDSMTICLKCSDITDQSCTCGKNQIKGCTRCGIDSCVQCSADKYFLMNGICVNQCVNNDECINGQICNIDSNVVNQCVNCLVGCLKCTSLIQCDQCPSGNFSINGTCKDCSMIEKDRSCYCGDNLIQNCSRCGLMSTCSICQVHYILYRGVCVLGDCDLTITCKNGQYCQIIETIPNKCINCDEGCDTCNQYYCVVCLENYHLINGQCLKDECNEIVHCKDGQYCQISESLQNKCIYCTLGCAKCTQNTCQECQSGFKLINEQCLKSICDDNISCQKGQFCQMEDNIPNKCVFCDQTCQECDSNICFRCISGYELIDQQCIQNECDDIIHCQSGQYCQLVDQQQNKCKQCQMNCSYCDSQSCQQCFVGYKLINQICIKNDCDDRITCQQGFFCSVEVDKANTCIDCIIFPDKCEKSKTALFLFIAGIVSGVIAILIIIIIIIIVIKVVKRNKNVNRKKLKNNQSSSNMLVGSQV